MKTIRLYIKQSVWRFDEIKKEHVLVAMLVLTLLLLPVLMPDPEETARYLLKQMLPLVLIALVVYMVLLSLALWLAQRFWAFLGLPDLEEMVLAFKDLQVWQRLVFYYASFSLLLLSAVGVLIAVL